jgi:hypothetical protein
MSKGKNSSLSGKKGVNICISICVFRKPYNKSPDERRKTMSGKSIISKPNIGIFISMIAAAGILTAGDSFAFEKRTKAATSPTVRQERVVEHRDRKAITQRDMRQEKVVHQHRDRERVAPRTARHEGVVVKHRKSTVIAPPDVRHGSASVKHVDRYRNWTSHVYREKHFPRHDVARHSVIRRHFPSRHVVIRPSVGLIFSTLPIGNRTVWIADREYYYYDGIYYQSAPYGYVVVNPPPVTVVREYPGIVEPLENAEGWVSITVSTLNVHSGPTLNHPVIDQITLDTVLEVYGKADGWLYVQLTNGGYGWILSAFTAEAEPPASG